MTPFLRFLQRPKKKDTTQLHYEAWGDSISALNESAVIGRKGRREGA
jgi:hypothetical protein